MQPFIRPVEKRIKACIGIHPDPNAHFLLHPPDPQTFLNRFGHPIRMPVDGVGQSPTIELTQGLCGDAILDGRQLPGDRQNPEWQSSAPRVRQGLSSLESRPQIWGQARHFIGA